MQFAEINGVTLHYQVIGAPEGKPVMVFSNSLGTDFRIWRDVIVRLAGDFAIVTYDKHGYLNSIAYNHTHYTTAISTDDDYL